MTENTNITDDQAHLLLYLAGELSAVDRLAIEGKLAGDAQLRAELDDLRRIDSLFTQTLCAGDGADPIGSRVRSAERQTAKLLAQWQIDRSLKQETAAPAPRKSKRWPIWLYPLAAAAAVMFALGLWYLVLPTNPDGSLVNDDNDIPALTTSGGGFDPNRIWTAVAEDDDEIDLAMTETETGPSSDLERDFSMFNLLNETLQ